MDSKNNNNNKQQKRAIVVISDIPDWLLPRASTYEGLKVTEMIQMLQRQIIDCKTQIKDYENFTRYLSTQQSDFIFTTVGHETRLVNPERQQEALQSEYESIKEQGLELHYPERDSVKIHTQLQSHTAPTAPTSNITMTQYHNLVAQEKERNFSSAPKPNFVPFQPDTPLATQPFVITTTTQPVTTPRVSHFSELKTDVITSLTDGLKQAFSPLVTLHPGSTPVPEYVGTEDYVSALYTYAAKNAHSSPRFQLKETTGPPHAPVHTVECLWHDNWYFVKQRGSKKDAERSLAKFILQEIEKKNCRGCLGAGIIMKSQSLDEDHYTARMRKSKEVKLRKQRLSYDRSIHDTSIRPKNKPFETEVASFHTYLESHGYIASNMKHVPKHLIKQALDYYVTGHGLINIFKIRRLNDTEQRLFQRDLAKLPVPNGTPQKGAKVRQAILRGYRDLYPHENGIFSQAMKSQGLMDWLPTYVQTKIREYKAARDAQPSVARVVGQEVGAGFMDTVKKEVSGIYKSVSEWLSYRQAEIGSFITIIGYIAVTAILCGIFGWMWVHTARLIILGTVGLGKAILNWGYTDFSSQGKDGSDSEEEDDDETMKSQALDETMRVGLLQLIWQKLKGLPEGVDSFISQSELSFSKGYDRLTKFSIAFNSINAFLTTVTTYMKKAVDFLSEQITGIPYFTDTVVARKIQNEWKELSELCSGPQASRLKTDKVFCQQIIDSFNRLSKLMKEPGFNALMEGKQTSLNLLRFKLLDDVRTAYMTLNNAYGRQEPIWVSFEGKPGQGKTLFMKTAIMGLRRSLRLPAIQMNEIYTRTLDKFWSNYSNQWVTMIDDIFQVKETEFRGMQAREMIHLVNTVPYPVDMPGVTEKGVTFFNSPVIMSTTNAIHDAVVNLGIEDPNALWRRRTLSFDIKLKPGVVPANTASLTIDQFKNDYIVEQIFKVATPQGVKFNHVPVTSSQVIQLMSYEYQIRERNYLLKVPMTQVTDADFDNLLSTSPPPPGPPPPPPPPPPQPPSGPPSGPPPPYNSLLHGKGGPRPWKQDSNSSMSTSFDQKVKDWEDKVPLDQMEYDIFNGPYEEERRLDDSDTNLLYDDIDNARSTSHQGVSIFDSSDEETPMKSQVLEHQVAILFPMVAHCSDVMHCAHVKGGCCSFSWNSFVSSIMDRPCCYYDVRREFWKLVKTLDPGSQLRIHHAYYNWFNEQFHFFVEITDTGGDQTFRRLPRVLGIRANTGDWRHIYHIANALAIDTKDFNGDLTYAVKEMLCPIWPDDVCQKYPPAVRRTASTMIFGVPHFCATVAEIVLAHGPTTNVPLLMRNLFPQLDIASYPKIWTRCKTYFYDVAALTLPVAATFTYIIGLVSLASILGLCICAIKALGFKIKKKWDLQSQSTDKFQTKLQGKVMKARVKGAKKLKSQYLDENADALANKILGTNQYWTKFFGKNGRSCYGWLLFVEGSVAVTANHLVQRNGGLDKVQLNYNPNSEGEYVELVPDATLPFLERDICYVRFANCQPRPSLRKHIPQESIQAKTQGPTRVTVQDGGKCLVQGVYAEPITRNTTDGGLVKGIYAYGMKAEDGECGAANLMYNGSIPEKLFGIHVAGDDRGALISPLLKGEWDSLLLQIGDKPLDQVMMSNCMESEIYIPPEIKLTMEPEYGFYHKGMKQVGKLSRPFGFPTVNEFQKSVIGKGADIPTSTGETVHMAPPYPVLTAPAKLRKGFNAVGDELDPLVLSLRKFNGKKVLIMPPEFSEDDSWDGVFPPEIDYFTLVMLDMDTATFGDTERGIDGIDITTSSAYPFSAFGFTRESLINKELRKIHPMLRAAVQYRLDEARQGRIVPLVAIGMLKSETRPIDRVEKYYTRMFMCGPVDHLIFSRMVLGAYKIAVTSTRYADSQVGMNPYSAHWKILYDKLLRFNKKQGDEEIIDSDVDGWDINFIPQFAHEFTKQFRKRVTQDEYWLACIFSAISSALSSYKVIGDTVVRSDDQPSGWFMTSDGNSALNSVKNRVLFKIASKSTFGMALPFNQYVEEIVFGDDVNMAYDPEIKPWFNGKIVASLAKQSFNHTHTDPNKGQDIPEGRKVSDIVFLQRQYRFEQGLLVAPLAEKTLHSMVQWIRKNKKIPHEIQFKVNCDTALMEWALHGREVFEKNKIIINVFLRAVHQPQFTRSFDDCWDEHVLRLTQ